MRCRRTGVPRNAFARGAGSAPSTMIESRSITATSRTWGASAASSPAAAVALMPPPSMVLQKGQPTATSPAPVERASSARLSAMRVPSFSSMNMRAPPAPQQKPLLRLRSISTSPAGPPAMDSSSSRGGSNTLLCRPRKHGSWYVIGLRSLAVRGIGFSSPSRTRRLSSWV